MKTFACAMFMLASLVLPMRLNAQLEFLTGLFKEVQSVTFYAQSALVENQTVEGSAKCLGLKDVGCGAGTEIMINLAAPKNVDLKLGLGASFIRGIHEANPEVDLQIAVRSLPSFSIYLTHVNDGLQPYIGASFGIADLWNAQAYDTIGREYSMQSSTFELGGTAGVYKYVNKLGFGLFAQYSYRWRHFSSVNYTLSTGRDTVPTSFPRQIDFSGHYLALGTQFEVKRTPPTPAFFPGVWVLSRVDAQQLPALVAAQPSGSLSGRAEILSGTLMLGEARNDTGSYAIDIRVRYSTVNPAGQVQSIDSIAVRTEAGRYTVKKDVLRLMPSTEVLYDPRSLILPPTATEYNALRLDDEIRIPESGQRYGFVFRKTKGESTLPERDEASGTPSRTPGTP